MASQGAGNTGDSSDADADLEIKLAGLNTGWLGVERTRSSLARGIDEGLDTVETTVDNLANVAADIVSGREVHWGLVRPVPAPLKRMLPRGWRESKWVQRVRVLAVWVSLLVPLIVSAVLISAPTNIVSLAKSVHSPRTVYWWLPFALSYVCLKIDYSRYRLVSALKHMRAPEVLRVMLGALPAHTIMVSYCWGDGPVIPRKTAKVLSCAWIDVQNMVPGRVVKDSCLSAVKNARYRIVFLSDKYLKSANCQMEWDEISKTPADCMVLAYPNTDRTVIENLRDRGFLVFDLREEPQIMSQDTNEIACWLVDRLASNGLLGRFCAIRSPLINEPTWTLMLAHYYRDWSIHEILWSLGMLAAWVLLGVLSWEHCVGDFKIIFSTLCAVNAAAVLLSAAYYGRLSLPPIPDAASLYLVLLHLKAIEPLHLYCDDARMWNSGGVKYLISKECLHRAVIPSDATVRIVCVDDLPADDPTLTNDDDHTMFWTRNRIRDLPPDKANKVSHRMLSVHLPSLEIISCVALASELGCPRGMEDLSTGTGQFEFWSRAMREKHPMLSVAWTRQKAETILHWRSRWWRDVLAFLFAKFDGATDGGSFSPTGGPTTGAARDHDATERSPLLGDPSHEKAT